MKKHYLTILCFIMVLVSPYILLADEGYKIKGKVIDQTSRDELSGASIRILNTKLGAISGKKGNFKIDDIETQSIKLVTTFIGYRSDTTELIFKGKSAELLIELMPDSYKSEGIVVEGDASGRTKAFIDQQKAENIKNIVSSEQIEQFPDMNAAEAMQRIPGITLQRDQGEGRYVQLRGTPPEFTNFNINGEQIPSPEGDVRYVGMDIISADQIESIEVSKVLTPDLDADGIGGNVNIITKKANSEIPEINTLFSAGYSELRGTNNYQFQFSYSQKYGQFGFNVNSSYYLNNYGSDNMEFDYAKGPFWGSTGDEKNNYYVQYREAQLRHYEITRERIGLSSAIDFQINNEHQLYLRGMYNNFSDDETRRRKILDLEDALSLNYYINGNIEHETRERQKIQNVSSLNLGGISKFGFMELDYEGAYSIATEDVPDMVQTLFGNTGQYVSIKFYQSEDFMPKAYFPDSNNAKKALDYETYKLDELLFESSTITDRNYTAKINFQIPYILSDNKGYIKFGGKARFKTKTRNNTSQDYGAYFTTSAVYPGTGPELNLATVEDDFVENDLLGKGYVIDHMPSSDEMRQFFELNSQFFIYDRTKTKVESFGQDYTANEDIYAGYLMTRFDLHNLMILAGARYELTKIDYQGIKIITEKGKYKSMEIMEDERSHEYLLPQIQFRYQLNQRMNLRLAYTQTYSRPNFEDVLPYREEDREEVKYGNPNLVYPESKNLDLLAEFYPDNQSVFSGGFFYKNIDNFIFYYKRFAHEGLDFSNYGIVEIEMAVNGIEAFVLGAELQTQYKFTSAPDFFSNFGIYLNYTYTYSEARIWKRESANYTQAVVIFDDEDFSIYSKNDEQEIIPLPGQAMHTANIAPYYDDGELYLRISCNFHDSFLYQLGADKDLDEYYHSSLHLDFNASYKINDNTTIFIDLVNLTDAPLMYYIGSEENISQQEYYSWTGRLGIKLTF